MPDDERLRLIALDEEDLAVLSAHVQDSVLKLADVHWLQAERRFVLGMNRFAWEALGPKPRESDYQRRRAALDFARVETVRSSGIDRAAKDAVLNLLAVRFEPGDPPSGDIVLDFAGGGALRLGVECLEAQLTDLGPAWSTARAPAHELP